MNPDLVHWVDEIPGPGDDIRSRRWSLTWGGKAANAAMCLASWDVPTILAGLVLGADAMGDALLAALDSPFLDRSFVERDPSARTGHCLVMVTPDGDRTIVCAGYAESRWQTIESTTWSGIDVVLADGFGGEAAATVVTAARDRGISVVWLDAPVQAAVDAVVWSGHEHDLADMSASPAGTVLLTRGGEPLELRIGADWFRFSPPEITVQDATGAGDAVAAGLARGIGKGLSHLEAARWAVAAGAAAAARGRLGGVPDAREIERLVADVRLVPN